MRPLLLFPAILLSVLAQDSCAAEKAAHEAKTVRLLTIGNSFSHNATRYLGDLAKAGGHSLIHRPIIVGGATLQLHAEKAQKHEKDAADKAGLYANGRSLRQELLADAWDCVTIQQACIKSHDIATYQPYAGWLRDYITRHAPKAKLLVHETWAYRKDDPRFTKPSGKAGEPATQEAMFQALRSAYARIAAELGGQVIPVGDAFYAADTDAAWGYQPDPAFDFKAARQPALPGQTHSLHIGWQWKKQKDGTTMLSMDGHHANSAGEYLGACVWYEVLFGTSVVGNGFLPKDIEPGHARFLQETAHRAVSGR